MNIVDYKNRLTRETKINKEILKRKRMGQNPSQKYSTKYYDAFNKIKSFSFHISNEKLCQLVNEQDERTKWDVYTYDNKFEKRYEIRFQDRTHKFDVLHADYSNEDKQAVLEKIEGFNWFQAYLNAKVDKDDNLFYQYYYSKSNNKPWHKESVWTGITRLPTQLKHALENYLEKTVITKSGIAVVEKNKE